MTQVHCLTQTASTPAPKVAFSYVDECTEPTHTGSTMTIRILHADDNQTFRKAVKHFLDELPGVTCVGQAQDGPEALAKAKELQPDLVLLDIAMPTMNGMEVARVIQSWERPPYIVFLSLYDSSAYQACAHALGALAFIGKSDFVAELRPLIVRLGLAVGLKQPQ